MSSAHDRSYHASPAIPPPPPPAPAPTSPPRVTVAAQAQQQQQPAQTSQTSPLRRLAVQPPLLTTALAPPQGVSFLHSPTPASATSLSLPFAPYAASPAAYAASPAASPMTMRNHASVPYNPQQWGRHGAVGGAYVPHPAGQTPTATGRPLSITGMEAAMPSPPPPYSPGQNPSIPQAVSTSPHLSGSAFPPPQHPPTSAHPSEYVPSAPSRPTSSFPTSRPGSMVIPTSATSVSSSQQFPPPPPRSTSRDKLHSKFSLSAFRNRNADHSPGPSAIDSLRINTSEALSRAPASPGLPPSSRMSQVFPSAGLPERRWSPDTPVRAPTARRAASAGALGLVESRTPIEGSPSPAQGSWGPGLPLPPPPPGPPPSSSRSQSLGRGMDSSSSRNTAHLPAPPTRRPGQSTLTPIPPTPIGWQEEQVRNRSKSPAAHGLHIDTSAQAFDSREHTAHASENEEASISSGPTTSTAHSSSTLSRAPAKRDPSARGIRERRSESRAAKDRSEPNNNPWAQDMEEAAASKPADLVLGTPDANLSRRGAFNKHTPRSAGAVKSPKSAQVLDDTGSSNSTPRVIDSARRIPTGAAPTPPFSPGTDTFDHHASRKAPAALPPKALPTPPLYSHGDVHGADLTSPSGGAKRSTSQSSLTSDLDREPSSSSTPKPLDAFAQGSIERHRVFIEKESTAQSDEEKLELFAQFIVAESRLRRDRYSGAFAAMAGDIVDLTRDLWRSYGSTGRRSTTPSAQGASVPSGRRSQASTIGESPDTRLTNSVPTTAASPASSVMNFTPHTEPASPSSATSQKAHEQNRNTNFQPTLSPIPSMAMSTVPDEEDSRGRSASRWWEASNESASFGAGGRRLERSKRESKYMSLPKEARESLQWAGETYPSPAYSAGPSSQQDYGPHEYPPEKLGWHDEVQQRTPQSHGFYPSSAPTTPDPHKLDVSRLVTLPPPYPRHHPAVNNSHPDLASIRSNLRTRSDLEEVATIKERFKTKSSARKEQEKTLASDRKAQLRYNIQENIRNSIMSYADAAQAEADFQAREEKRAQDTVQTIFDTFQTEVANPLHAMFCERITKVSASIEHLKGRLSEEAQAVDPNKTQEEGDEQPELLELLTLLKWLFEAREILHKEMFELEDERNDLYKDIIILPYVQTKNKQKVKEATEFFSRDAQDRKVVFEKEILKRHEDLMSAIEENVTRGVEAQLSAFWDIAPGLLTVVQKVPQRLSDFEILIPPQEYQENPLYNDFPLQYLYSLLAHAGRSAYQFIESQTNLLCLLHEVKTGVMTAGTHLMETQRTLEGEDKSTVDEEMRAIREDEERRLTDDLKDKVGLVESQWGEALGNGLEECKSRVEAFLVQQGGWDDSLNE